MVSIDKIMDYDNGGYKMTIAELRKELSKVPNQEKDVSIVVGNDDGNSVDTWEFELHHTEDWDHPLELFVHENAGQYS